MKSNVIISLITLMLLSSCDLYSGNKSNIKLIDNDKDHKYFVNSNTNLVVIPDQVVDFDRQGEFVFVLRMVSESIDCFDEDGIPTIITHYSNKKEYWLINQINDEVEGPLEANDFYKKINKKGINEVKLEVPKTYKSNTERFILEKKSCSKVEYL